MVLSLWPHFLAHTVGWRMVGYSLVNLYVGPMLSGRRWPDNQNNIEATYFCHRWANFYMLDGSGLNEIVRFIRVFFEYYWEKTRNKRTFSRVKSSGRSNGRINNS